MELQVTGDRHIAYQPYRVLTAWWCHAVSGRERHVSCCSARACRNADGSRQSVHCPASLSGQIASQQFAMHQGT